MKIAVQDDIVSKSLRDFWELESLGISNDTETMSELNKEALESSMSQIEFKDGRYEVKLPWKQERPALSNNFRIAKSRFLNLVKKFRTDAMFYDRYRNEIEDQLRLEIIEPVPEEEDEGKEKYYLPHHAVTRESKQTTKTRIVFDASSHDSGCPSLNDCLLTGPNMNPNLLSVLLRFRLHKVAFMADIEKAFLQISLAAEDRDAVRFLWLDGSLTYTGEQMIKEFRMTRVLFGVSSSPFLLASTLRHHFSKFEESYPEICEHLNDNFYVDDLIAGASDTIEAFQISEGAKNIVGSASMNLRKWKTNDWELRNRWQENGFAIEERSDFESSHSPLKVLGLIWDNESDVFKFELSALLEFLIERKNTKRYVLQASARVYDPIGFLSPFVIRVKCLFQQMWEMGLSWDETLPKELQEKWNDWCLELPRLREISVPRHYFMGDQHATTAEYQLHGFCDASERAYGAVVYLRFIKHNGAVEIAFVTSKVRVAPLKKLTLPRLELMAALLGARLMHHVKTSLRLKEPRIYLWSDSTITLHWIRGSARQWKPFVSNRVIEIQTLSDPGSWSHCRSHHNPADVLSRGCKAENLVKSELWWRAASWLSFSEENWPKGPQDILSEEDTKTEQRQASTPITQMNCNTEIQEEVLLSLDKYSSLLKVYRITAWIKRFVQNSKPDSNKAHGPLKAEEIIQSEKYWVGATQKRDFGAEVEQLRLGKPISKNSKIVAFNPIIDNDGLLCLGGRLDQANLGFSQTHPWIIPNDHEYSKLLVRYCHEKVLHAGVNDTLVQVREKFWVLRGRQLVKKVLNQCMVCKRFKVQPGSETVGPLPRDRISEAPSFEVTGIDFAEPLYTKGTKKAYIALFTCAVTRALHLELVSDLTTETFLLAFRRFVARRGMVKTIYSDNALTFKRANKDLTELWKTIKDPTVQDFYGKHGITWKFIVPRAAWWGGFWERMVRSTKSCLRKILGRSSLTFEELATTLAEVEAVVNSRPITYTYNDSQEPFPLSPAHFLVGQRITALPRQDFGKGLAASATREQMTKRWKYRQTLIEGFWRRWRKEYLLGLRTAHHNSPARTCKEFQVDEVVLLGEDGTPRQMWKLGVVTKVFRGRDNKVRSCELRLSSGVTLRRPIQLLYPLEI